MWVIGTGVGGTTATSGGGLRVPRNHLMPGLGIDDNRDNALRYPRVLAGGDVPETRITAFVDNPRRLLKGLCDGSRVRYMAMAEYAGVGMPAAGHAGGLTDESVAELEPNAKPYG